MKLFHSLFVLLLFLYASTSFADVPITLSSPSIDGTMTSGDSKTYTYTLNNQTNVSIPILSLDISGNSKSVKITSSCNEVPSRGHCDFKVTVNPTDDDVDHGIDARVNVTHQGRLPHPQITSSIKVRVERKVTESPLTLSAPSIEAAMTAGDSKSYTYTLTNPNNDNISVSLEITGNSKSVQIASPCNSVSANGRCDFTIVINPTDDDVAKNINDVLNVSYQGRLSHPTITTAINVTVKKKIIPEKLSASISSPNPTLVAKQVSGTLQTVKYVFTNTSPTLPITTLSRTGLSGNVTQTTNCPTPLVAGANCEIRVTFAPMAEDIGKLHKTLTINYGGESVIAIGIAIEVVNPLLIASGLKNDKSMHVFESRDLGQHWVDITKKINLNSPISSINSIAGGVTRASANQQLLNDTVMIVAGNDGNGGGYVLTSQNGQWQDLQLASKTNVPNVIGYGLPTTDDATPYFFSGLSNKGVTSFGYNSNAENNLKVNDSSVADTTPSAATFGGGYYLLGLTSTISSLPGKIVYTNDPTEAKQHWVQSGPLPDVITSTIAGIAFASVNNLPTFVAVAGTNAYQNTDVGSFKSWIKTNPFSHTAVGIIYNSLRKEFVVIDIEGNYYTSTNGLTWGPPVSIGSFVAHAITFSKATGTMVVVGSDNKVYYSRGKTVDWQAGAVDVDSPTTFTAVASSA